jgi:hypothetical protein
MKTSRPIALLVFTAALSATALPTSGARLRLFDAVIYAEKK